MNTGSQQVNSVHFPHIFLIEVTSFPFTFGRFGRAEETFVPVEWKFLALLTSNCDLMRHQDEAPDLLTLPDLGRTG
jgi:hypothetical protein